MKIALLGDIALFGKYSVDGNPRVRDYFRGAAEYLKTFDHVVGNLETPFGRDIVPSGPKSAYIKADPRNIELLNYLSIDVVNLANNHLFDYGVQGYHSTLDVLRSGGIEWFGAEGHQLRLESHGGRVALHGYCSFNTNPLGVSRGGEAGVNPLNVAEVEAQLRRNHGDGFLNIVSVHSGQEHINYPSRDDVRMARRFASVCPYVYYGHHPHVLQGFEEVDGSAIAYSIGNFCFDDVYTDKSPEPLIRQSLNNRQGAILELEVHDARLVSHRMTPVFAGDEGLEVGSAEIEAHISDYSAALAQVDEEYEARRRVMLAGYLGERKRARDLDWYIKRLNLNSVGILWRARYNRIQYQKNVLKFLD